MTHWLSHVASDVATVLELIGHWITFNTFGGST